MAGPAELMHQSQEADLDFFFFFFFLDIISQGKFAEILNLHWFTCSLRSGTAADQWATTTGELTSISQGHIIKKNIY